MKRIIQKTGVRRFYGEDFINIQNESLEAIEAHFGGEFQNVVLKGCLISGGNISAGIVLIDGVLCRYLGETSVSTPRYLVKVETETEAENYETGGSKPTYKTVYAVGQSVSPGITPHIVLQAGVRNTLMEQIGDNLQIPAANVSGTLAVSNIPNISADKITSGVLNTNRIPNFDASKIQSGVINSARIPSLDASKIVSGTFNALRIPNLDAGIITSGTFNASRIPNISAALITSGFLSADRLNEESIPPGKIAVGGGTLDDAVIPNLNASRITAGTFADARIPNLVASKITSGIFAEARLPVNARGFGNWNVLGSIRYRESASAVHVIGVLNDSNPFIDLSSTGVTAQELESGGILFPYGSSVLAHGICNVRIITGKLEARLSSKTYQGGLADYDDLTSGERSTSEVYVNAVFVK